MSEEYDNYRNSPEWKALKKRTRERDNYTCQLCGKYLKDKEWMLHPHHITYERIYNKLDSDIVTLCADCHSRLHLAKDAVQPKLIDLIQHEKEEIKTAAEPVRFKYAIKRERLLMAMMEMAGINRPASSKMLSMLHSTMMQSVYCDDFAVYYGYGRADGFYSSSMWSIKHGNNKRGNTIKQLNTKVADMYKELIQKRKATEYQEVTECQASD